MTKNPFSLDYAIAPYSYDEFMSKYYEKDYLLIKRNDPKYFEKLLTLQDIDHVLSSQQLSYPKTKMVNEAQAVENEKYLQGNIINVAKMNSAFLDGNTMVFSGLHDHLPSLRHLIDWFTEHSWHRFQTNIYFTPANAKGFKTHYDDHDVFVYQCSGTKKWRIYKNVVELASRNERFKEGEHEPGDVLIEFTMEPGDFLYIPRGMFHDARTNDDHSLHITGGLIAYTWTDFMVEAIMDISKKDVNFKKNIPFGYPNVQDHSEDQAHFEKLCEALKSLPVADGFRRFGEDMTMNQRPNMAGHLLDAMQSSAIDGDQKLQVRKNVMVLTEETEDDFIIKFLDKEVKFPKFAKDAMLAAIAGATFSANTLPNCMDANGKLVLAKRLLKEGVVQRV